METKELIEFLRSCGKRGCECCPDVECCTGPGWLMLKAAELKRRKALYVLDIGNSARPAVDTSDVRVPKR